MRECQKSDFAPKNTLKVTFFGFSTCHRQASKSTLKEVRTRRFFGDECTLTTSECSECSKHSNGLSDDFTPKFSNYTFGKFIFKTINQSIK